MSAIKPSVEHRRIADEIWSAIWDKGRADAAPPIATALAEAEARGRKAAFEEAAKWHDEQADHYDGEHRRAYHADYAERMNGLRDEHNEAAATIRTLAAKES